MRLKIKITASFIILSCISLFAKVPAGYQKAGHVESLRSGGLVVVHLDGALPSVTCSILFEDRIVGELRILEVLEQGQGHTRVLAKILLNEGVSPRLVHSGTDIITSMKIDRYERDLTGRAPVEQPVYRTEIISPVDGRMMRLVPEGNFYMGSNQGEKDEYPLHKTHREAFYMDVCEVSNSDYLLYVKNTASPAPVSWEGKTGPNWTFRDDKYALLPVLVTYHEAEEYARWAGKRLPTEIEWEKAARGSIGSDAGSEPCFPWGSRFVPSKANCEEFWQDEESRKNAETQYGISLPGLLPVDSFKESASPFGMINMAGNAPEWTSDWYRAYKGNRKGDRRYGTQYRVIRGGGWWSATGMLRVSSREPGGKPNLYRDNSAGFRCVRDINFLDRTESP